MSESLKIVLSLSFSGTLLFFTILGLKPLYKNQLSKRWQYYIWLVVVVRMLMPFTPETTLVGSIFEYFNNINVEITQVAKSEQEEQLNFDSDNNYIVPNIEPQSDTTSLLSIEAIFSKVYENLSILWAVIAFALLIRKITMYQSFARFVKAGWSEVSDIEILNILADVGERIGVKRPIELFINPLISSPMLLGFFRPYIILPSINLESIELSYIMRHELTHYKCLDMFYKWFVQMTVCLHWFNPFVYLLTKEINKCCELSCDEAIIRTLNQDEKKAYGDTLLNSLEARGNYKDQLATVMLTEGGKQLKERLDAIMKFKKESKVVIAITLALTIMLCIGATAVGAYAAPSSSRDNVAHTNILLKDKQVYKKKMTREESLIINFAPYQSYGLVYKPELDRAFWNEQEVKAFVDIRKIVSGDKYFFNLGYVEPDSHSTLYLMAVRDKKGLVTGIEKMSKELQNNLYGTYDQTSLPEPYNSALEKEIKDNLSEIGKNENQYSTYLEKEIKDNLSEIGKNENQYSTYGEEYIVFDGTASLNDYPTITATDKFNSKDIPKAIADWILTCEASKKVYVKRTTAGGKIDAWIYYDSDTRMAWNMKADGTTLKFTLTNNAPKSVSGPTLIHYQAPAAYKRLEVFYKNKKQKVCFL